MRVVRSDEGRLDGSDCARRIGHDPMTQAHLVLASCSSDKNRTAAMSPHDAPISSLILSIHVSPTIASHDPCLPLCFTYPMKIGRSRCVHVSAGESSITVTYVSIHARAPMVITWTWVHAIDALSFIAITSDVHGAATCRAQFKSPGNIVPHGGNERKSCV